MIQVNKFQLGSNIFNLGALLGTNGSTELINNINANSGSGSFFGSVSDPFRTGFQSFMNTVVEPVRQVGYNLASTVGKMQNKDEYRPITSVSDLERGIPPCMHLGIVYHEPVRRLMEEERIDAFGLTPKDLNEGDMFHDVLHDGVVRDIHSTTIPDDGVVTITEYYNSHGPTLDSTEREALFETREFISEFLEDEKTNYMDVTNYPSLRC